MNRPPAEFGRIPPDPLRTFGTQCLERAGMLADHAEQLAHLLHPPRIEQRLVGRGQPMLL